MKKRSKGNAHLRATWRVTRIDTVPSKKTRSHTESA